MFHTVEEALKTFEYHKPSDEQTKRIQDIRLGAKLFVMSIFQNCPNGADRTCAVRKVHEAMMTANKSIVLEGEVAG